MTITTTKEYLAKVLSRVLTKFLRVCQKTREKNRQNVIKYYQKPTLEGGYQEKAFWESLENVQYFLIRPPPIKQKKIINFHLILLNTLRGWRGNQDLDKTRLFRG